MVNNSQGHSTYSEDTLLVSLMNVHPGGKQAQMHDGWFIHGGLKIIQPMVYPANHPTYPNVAKGIKVVLMEHGLFTDCLRRDLSQGPARGAIMKFLAQRGRLFIKHKCLGNLQAPITCADAQIRQDMTYMEKYTT